MQALPSKDTRNIPNLNHFKNLAFLGGPGAARRDDAIFSGESLFRERTSHYLLKFAKLKNGSFTILGR